MGAQLAEVNVACPVASLDAPKMAGFVKAVDDVNWLAEKSPGFVWRLRATDGPVVLAPFEGDVVTVTVSVWTDFESLQKYVFRSAHALFMRRRGSWFVPLRGFTTALWWVEEGTQPTLDHGLARLARLRARGPSPDAFSIRQQFGPEAAAGG